jgi:putative transposase
MSHYIRPHVPGAPVFFTLALANRTSDVLVRDMDRLRDAVRETRDAWPFAIIAMVVLPDHLHAIWQLPDHDADDATRLRLIKARFSGGLDATKGRSPSKVSKGEKGIWQRRYWEHHIRDEADLAAHIRYCRINPVKHGLVTRAVDWPHSSIHRDMRRGIVAPEWSGAGPDGQFGETVPWRWVNPREGRGTTHQRLLTPILSMLSTYRPG